MFLCSFDQGSLTIHPLSTHPLAPQQAKLLEFIEQQGELVQGNIGKLTSVCLLGTGRIYYIETSGPNFDPKGNNSCC